VSYLHLRGVVEKYWEVLSP